MPKKPLRFLHTGLAATSLLATMALSVATAVPASASPADNRRQTVVTALDFNSTGWRFLQVSPTSEVPQFAERHFDDSDWSLGQAGFGTTNGTCSWNNATSVKTPWNLNTDLLVRHWVHIPRNAQEVRIQGTVDNDARVYMNGQLLQTVQSGNCAAGAIDVVVPARFLASCNLLAIRGHDAGVASFLDVRVTYVEPTEA